MRDKHFKVLCIDGGGMRGVFAAKMLSLIEAELHMNIYESFDLIVGTSTGSIIAGAVATQYPLERITEDYLECAPAIFKKRVSFYGLLRSKYDSAPLREFLRNKMGNVKLGEIEKPLILNATNASVGGVYVFKSSYQKAQRKGDYVRDGETPLFEAILASCAAPIYFDPVDIRGTLVCDGGIWANNPSLVGYTDAIRNFGAKNIKILSLGTGRFQQTYGQSAHWGFLRGWGNTKLVDFMMSCQTDFPKNVIELIDSDAIFRINHPIDNHGLDNYQNAPRLVELAKSEFTKASSQITNFLNPPNSEAGK